MLPRIPGAQVPYFSVMHAKAIKSLLMCDTDHSSTITPALHMPTFKGETFSQAATVVSEGFPGLITTFSKLLDKLLIVLLITSAKLSYFFSPLSSDSIAWHLPSVSDPQPRAAKPCVR